MISTSKLGKKQILVACCIRTTLADIPNPPKTNLTDVDKELVSVDELLHPFKDLLKEKFIEQEEELAKEFHEKKNKHIDNAPKVEPLGQFLYKTNIHRCSLVFIPY